MRTADIFSQEFCAKSLVLRTLTVCVASDYFILTNCSRVWLVPTGEDPEEAQV